MAEAWMNLVPESLLGADGALVSGLVWVLVGTAAIAIRAARFSSVQLRWRLLGIVVAPGFVLLAIGLSR